MLQQTKQDKLNKLDALLKIPKQNAHHLAEAGQSGINLLELQRYMESQMTAERQMEIDAADNQIEPNPFARLTNEQLMTLAVNASAIISTGARLEQGRRDFFVFCNLRAPNFYRADREYIVKLCRELQDFYESPDELIMLMSLPPRFGKSRTAGLFTQWVYGCKPSEKVMTGSYNVTLSTTFSKTVRNGISEEKASPDKIVYSDIFPNVRIQRGDAAMNLWSIEGQYASYLATSPDGTATGFGGSLIIIDDLIKSAAEAFNDDLLATHYSWFTDTMLSRLEQGGKIIIIMTRWASKDLAGRVKEHFTSNGIKVREVVMKAKQDDGTMLCPDILSEESYLMKIGAMSEEIASANYQQIPVDVKGRLYSSFKTYDALPSDDRGRSLVTGRFNYTDTADQGADYLCSIDYAEYNGEAYIINVIFTKDAMETTEPAVAKMLDEDNVNVADVESNNGGRGFARNLQEKLKQRGNRRCVVKWFHQSQNKKARIISNATWVMEHIYFPANWRDRWSDFYKALTSYQRAGKNAHDDAPDAVTGIAEHFTKPQKRLKFGKRRNGL